MSPVPVVVPVLEVVVCVLEVVLLVVVPVFGANGPIGTFPLNFVNWLHGIDVLPGVIVVLAVVPLVSGFTVIFGAVQIPVFGSNVKPDCESR